MILKNITYASVFAGSLLNGSDPIKEHTVDVEIVVLAKDLKDRNWQLEERKAREMAAGLDIESDDVFPRIMNFQLLFNDEPTIADVNKKLGQMVHSNVTFFGLSEGQNLFSKPETNTSLSMKVKDFFNEKCKSKTINLPDFISAPRSITIKPPKRELSFMSTQIPGGVYRKIKQRELTGKLRGKRL